MRILHGQWNTHRHQQNTIEFAWCAALHNVIVAKQQMDITKKNTHTHTHQGHGGFDATTANLDWNLSFLHRWTGAKSVSLWFCSGSRIFCLLSTRCTLPYCLHRSTPVSKGMANGWVIYFRSHASSPAADPFSEQTIDTTKWQKPDSKQTPGPDGFDEGGQGGQPMQHTRQKVHINLSLSIYYAIPMGGRCASSGRPTDIRSSIFHPV